MSTKNLTLVLIVIGLFLLLVSALAEPLGLGSGNGIGPRQLSGMIVGALLFLIGLRKRAKVPAHA